MNPEFLVVLITCASQKEAERIANVLLEKKRIACANVIEGVRSLFWWEGKINQENETLLVIKTQSSLFEELVDIVKGEHSYSVPEIIALPIVKGSESYLEWIKESIKG